MDPKFWIFLSIVWGCKGSKNYLPDAPSDENECSRRMNYLTDNYLNTQIIVPPQLNGKWVSERCEIRSGPLFMLRSYTFFPNNTFYLLQYFYSDDTCSSISHVVSIRGFYKYKDYSSSKLEYTITRITVTPHDLPYIESLQSKISPDCPKTIGKDWQIFTEYVVLNRSPTNLDLDDDTVDPFRRNANPYIIRSSKRANVEWRCFSSMNISYDELSIYRIQRRPAIDDKKARYELLLGSSYQDKGRSVKLLKFQLPLILLNETKDCFICNIIATKTNMHVPHLTATAALSLICNGQWISQTCEPRSKALYTIRKYRFNRLENSWESEIRYYSNFACSNLLMIHTTNGYYEEGPISTVINGATDIDFHVEKSYLTITDQNILESVESDPVCGIAYYWKLNVKKEIPSKQGCPSIDIVIPAVRYDIIKLDMDYYYSWGNDSSYILLLGDEGTINAAQGPKARPTAFEYPLMQCDSEPQEIFNSEPITPSDASTAKYTNWCIVLCIFLIMH